MAPADRAVAVATVEAAFGAKIDSVFVEFGDAVAAASIAQVHRARVRTSEGERDVAVKLLRPGVERRFARDLSDMFFAARSAERFEPSLRRLRLVRCRRRARAKRPHGDGLSPRSGGGVRIRGKPDR